MISPALQAQMSFPFPCEALRYMSFLIPDRPQVLQRLLSGCMFLACLVGHKNDIWITSLDKGVKKGINFIVVFVQFGFLNGGSFTS